MILNRNYCNNWIKKKSLFPSSDILYTTIDQYLAIPYLPHKLHPRLPLRSSDIVLTDFSQHDAIPYLLYKLHPRLYSQLKYFTYGDKST